MGQRGLSAKYLTPMIELTNTKRISYKINDCFPDISQVLALGQNSLLVFLLYSYCLFSMFRVGRERYEPAKVILFKLIHNDKRVTTDMQNSYERFKTKIDKQKLQKKTDGGKRPASRQTKALLEDDKDKNIVKGEQLKHAQKDKSAVKSVPDSKEKLKKQTDQQKLLKRLGGGNRLASRQIQALLEDQTYKNIVKNALLKHAQSEELKVYQAELIKLLNHLELTGKKVVILFDGRDASGKGGTIRRMTRYMNSKHCRVVALGKPTDDQKTEMHMKRYIEQLPKAGEMVLFDRSWYNRAMVEPVMGFCTKDQYKLFIDNVITYEKSFIEDKSTILIKLYFSVSKDEQARRFERRFNDPLRSWKLSEVDLQAQDLWDDFTETKYRLLLKSHRPESQWYVVRSDDKHQARLQTMKLILNLTKYRGRKRSLDFTPNKKIVISGAQELRAMQKQKKVHGRFIS